MEFRIDTENGYNISDHELSNLLKEVYVDERYTEAEYANTLFDAKAVRSRGTLITAHHIDTHNLAGIIIMVPPTSNAKKLASDNEVEIHLLTVKQEYRKNNLGEALINTFILEAKTNGYEKIVLWTHESPLIH